MNPVTLGLRAQMASNIQHGGLPKRCHGNDINKLVGQWGLRHRFLQRKQRFHRP